MKKAFVLGAGLGTRLKSLTEHLPKPLIPVFQRPLITCCFDHILSCGFSDLIVNTHHRPEAYDRFFPGATYRDIPITFRHEPEILETGGGIANIADLLSDDEPFLVYNGDILTDFPLQTLIDIHQKSDNMVTLALRSKGHAAYVALDQTNGRIRDINNMLGVDSGSYQFACAYVCNPDFLERLTPVKKESVVPKFLDLIKEGRLGGAIVDGGQWWDLGDRESYLGAHAALREVKFPGYSEDREWQRAIHPAAHVEKTATVSGFSSVGEGAIVENGAKVHDSIIWPGAYVTAGSELIGCVVRTGQRAEGQLEDADV